MATILSLSYSAVRASVSTVSPRRKVSTCSGNRPLTQSEQASLAQQTAELDRRIAAAICERPKRFDLSARRAELAGAES